MAQAGSTLAPDAARMLVDLIGDDLGRIDSELAKLAIEADGPRQPITPDRVSGRRSPSSASRKCGTWATRWPPVT